MLSFARNYRVLFAILFTTMALSPALRASSDSWIVDNAGDEKWRQRSVVSFLNGNFEEAREQLVRIRNDEERVRALKTMFTHARTTSSVSLRQSALQNVARLLILVRDEALRNQFITHAREYNYDLEVMAPIAPLQPPVPGQNAIPNWRRSQLIREGNRHIEVDNEDEEEESEEKAERETQPSTHTTINADLDVDIGRRLAANPRFSLSVLAVITNPRHERAPGVTPPGSAISRIVPRSTGTKH